MTTPADEIRAAAAKLRREAAEPPPVPDLTVEYPDLDAAAAHVKAGRVMQQKYALAQVLDDHARTWDPDPDVTQTWDARVENALTLARLINQ